MIFNVASLTLPCRVSALTMNFRFRGSRRHRRLIGCCRQTPTMIPRYGAQWTLSLLLIELRHQSQSFETVPCLCSSPAGRRPSNSDRRISASPSVKCEKFPPLHTCTAAFRTINSWCKTDSLTEPRQSSVRAHRSCTFCFHCAVTCIVFIVSLCRDVRAIDGEKRTALHYVCASRSKLASKIVDCLLEAGADHSTYNEISLVTFEAKLEARNFRAGSRRVFVSDARPSTITSL